MKNKKFVFTCLLFIIPLLLGIYFYKDLPQEMPSHFNFNNEVDAYMDKNILLFALPIGMLFVHIFMIFMLKKDPKNRNMPSIMMDLMYFFIPALTIFLIGLTITFSLGNDINIGFFTSLLIGVVLIIIGNYMPKIKQNYTMGIKTPWTLSNEEVWNKTHRFGGACFIIMGFGLILIGLFATSLFYLLLVFIIIGAFAPMAYSYFIYKKLDKNSTDH